MRWFLIIVLVAVLIFIIGGTMLAPQQAAQLRLGYSQEAPYAHLNEDAELTGIFVTAAEQVTAGMDVEQVDWMLHDFYQLFGSLQQKRIDVIAAGITITPERAESLCFTEPLLQAHSALLVLANSDIDANRSAAGKTIAVIAGSVEHQTLAAQGYSLLLVTSADEGATAVQQFKATGLALTEPSLVELQQRFKGQFKLVKLNGVADLEHLSAFAVHPSQVALVKHWNKAQRQLQQRADFKATAERLGFEIPTSPKTVTERCYDV